jgi:succinyl-CoA synthetase alpha subunit
MAKKTFEQIKPWDGTTGTGSEARQVIKENFEKVNDAIGEIDNDKIDKTAIKHVDGSSTTDVMSQFAITNLYNQLSEAIQTLDQDLYQIVNALQSNKIDKTAVKQVPGTSTTDLMSQKIISEMIEAIDLHSQYIESVLISNLQISKIDKIAIKQVSGNSETDLMSQKAVSSLQNMCNVTAEFPLSEGYYTIETAIAAVPTERRKPGLILIFLNSSGVFQQYRFDASTTSVWESEEFWNSYNPQSATGASFTDYISQAGTTLLLGQKIDKTAIKHVDGSSTTDVMSQSGITNLYNQLSEAIQTLDQDLYQIVNALQANKVDKTAIKQVPGTSTTDLMSQKIISEMIEAIDLQSQYIESVLISNLQSSKIDKTAIKQVSGNSETDLMSQKAVSSLQNMCNVTAEFPLSEGYYTIETAIAAVPAERRKPGLILIFLNSSGVFQQYRFDASTTSVWDSEEFWNSYNPQSDTGASFTDYISQAGTTFLLNQKFDKTDVENSDGNSQTKVVSQNHFTTSKTNLQNQIDANSAAFNKHVNPSNIAISYPPKITYRNTAHKSISVTENGDILRSVQYVKDDPFQTSVKVKPDGQIQVQHVGTTKISVVPTQDPSLYQDIDIEVVLPSMRKVGNVIRFTSTNAIRLT